LLNRILSEPHGKKFAVIVNEFGEIGIDNDLIVGADEEVFEMNNGCICCTVRGDLIRVIGGLLKRAGGFDGILIETTGLADPGPVAQTFLSMPTSRRRRSSTASLRWWMRSICLCASKTRKKPKSKSLSPMSSFSTKSIWWNKEELAEVERAIRAINKFARIVKTERSQVPLDQILGLGSFNLNTILQHAPAFLAAHDEHEHEHEHDHHHHDHDHEHCHEHHHHGEETCNDPSHHHHHEQHGGIHGSDITSLS